MNQKTITSQIVLNTWQTQLDRTTSFVNSLSDEEWMREVAPGKNRAIYLIGHLAAIHDAMPEILGLGKKVYPELHSVFVEAPDKSVGIIPSISELKQIWTTVHDRLRKEFGMMTTDDWFSRHESMNDADFEKNPARNKLSVLNTRTAHLAYHYGQLRLLK